MRHPQIGLPDPASQHLPVPVDGIGVHLVYQFIGPGEVTDGIAILDYR